MKMQQRSVLYHGSWQCCKPALASVSMWGTMRLAIFLLARDGVMDLDCQKAIGDLWGTWLDTQRMSAGQVFIRQNKQHRISPLLAVVVIFRRSLWCFAPQVCGWTTSVQCLRAAGCGERVFILVMLTFFLHEGKIHVLTLWKPSCSVKENSSPELYCWWGSGVGVDRWSTHVYVHTLC